MHMAQPSFVSVLLSSCLVAEFFKNISLMYSWLSFYNDRTCLFRTTFVEALANQIWLATAMSWETCQSNYIGLWTTTNNFWGGGGNRSFAVHQFLCISRGISCFIWICSRINNLKWRSYKYTYSISSACSNSFQYVIVHVLPTRVHSAVDFCLSAVTNWLLGVIVSRYQTLRVEWNMPIEPFFENPLIWYIYPSRNLVLTLLAHMMSYYT